MPVQELLIGSDQKRARTTGGIENPQLRRRRGGLAFQKLSNGVIDDVLDDVRGGVIDPSGLPDFRFVIDIDPAAGRDGDNLSEELLIDMA